jgi:hypothetical protein
VWLEQAVDGDEAAHTYIVMYDLEMNTRYTLLEHWDLSPESFAVSRTASPWQLL